RISVTLKESVLDAKALADQGQSAKEIKEYLETTAYQSSICSSLIIIFNPVFPKSFCHNKILQ
ncbi:MAG: hypothetical protein ACI4LN_02115, partial [Anaerovoracaceae bacterium]